MNFITRIKIIEKIIATIWRVMLSMSLGGFDLLSDFK